MFGVRCYADVNGVKHCGVEELTKINGERWSFPETTYSFPGSGWYKVALSDKGKQESGSMTNYPDHSEVVLFYLFETQAEGRAFLGGLWVGSETLWHWLIREQTVKSPKG